MITVILVCHERFGSLEAILRSWKNQKEVSELIVFDNSGSFRTDIPDTLVLSASKNLGPQGKYPISMLAKNKLVIYADDDIMPLSGLATDLLKYMKNDTTIVSIVGRVFSGNTHYESKGYRGENIKKPIEADWVGGGCCLAHRLLGCVPVEECPDMRIDDFWWQHYNDWIITNKIIAPTKNYKFLPENYRGKALHNQKATKKLREEYYRKWVKK